MIDTHHLVYAGVILLFLAAAIAVALASMLSLAIAAVVASLIRLIRRRTPETMEAADVAPPGSRQASGKRATKSLTRLGQFPMAWFIAAGEASGVAAFSSADSRRMGESGRPTSASTAASMVSWPRPCRGNLHSAIESASSSRTWPWVRGICLLQFQAGVS